jgi:exonuclease III
MKIVAWNMRFESSPLNWKAFAPDGEHRCHIALLNEAKRPPDGLELHVMTTSRTIGRDDRLYGGKKDRDWSTAVASPYPLQRPEDVWALPPDEDDRRSKLMTSRRGAWTAAVVSFPNGEKVTAISLYGLLDERSDASVHRSLSDLTPLLEDTRYNELLVLGGDLNPLWSADVGSMKLARVQGVFDRITRGFGLVDLLERTLNQENPQRRRLRSCTCSLGDGCWHVQTFRRNKASTRGCQDDYLFASPALAGRLDKCYALDFTNESRSDHVPIVATFDGF